VEVIPSVDAQRSAVRSIAWLDGWRCNALRVLIKHVVRQAIARTICSKDKSADEHTANPECDIVLRLRDKHVKAVCMVVVPQRYCERLAVRGGLYLGVIRQAA